MKPETIVPLTIEIKTLKTKPATNVPATLDVKHFKIKVKRSGNIT